MSALTTITTAQALDGPSYETMLRQVFGFMRTQDDGRYSSTAKMSILNVAEKCERAALRGPLVADNYPTIAVVTSPFTFDEDTEVKTGGMVAAAILWPADHKLMVVTHKAKRREGHGASLVYRLRLNLGDHMVSWVNRSNVAGQHFLLTLGFVPSGVNSQGGVSWVRGNPETTDGVEDHIDPLYSSPQLLRRRQPEMRDNGDDEDY